MPHFWHMLAQHNAALFVTKICAIVRLALDSDLQTHYIHQLKCAEAAFSTYSSVLMTTRSPWSTKKHMA